MGDIISAGNFQGTVDFGGGTLNSGGFPHVFVAKFDPSGAYEWAKQYGDFSEGAEMSPGGVGIDACGNVFSPEVS